MGLEKGIKKGIGIGEERGVQKEKINIALQMLDDFDMHTIARITGFSFEFIEELKKNR